LPDLGTIASLIAAGAAVLGIGLGLWWRRRDMRQKAIDEALAAASSAAQRWRVSTLSTVHGHADPDLRKVLESVRRWRTDAAPELVAIKRACSTGVSLPARQLEQAVMDLSAFQAIVEPLAAIYQPDMNLLYEKDPAWKQTFEAALTRLQAQMAPILRLDSISAGQLKDPTTPLDPVTGAG